MKGIILSIIVSFAFGISAQAEERALKLPKAQCNESVFKPCICASKTPKFIKYRPRYKACGGKAAALLSKELSNSFSVVLRDRQNRDRYPSSGFNGCSKAEADMGLARCSAYKCQNTFHQTNADGDDEYVCCFGASGKAPILSKASRMTIKVRDVPESSADPLIRVCLPLFSAKYPMN